MVKTKEELTKMLNEIQKIAFDKGIEVIIPHTEEEKIAKEALYLIIGICKKADENINKQGNYPLQRS